MEDLDCPFGVVDEVSRLASQIEARDLPIDFDPGDLTWNENLVRIGHLYTNHDALSGQLQDWLAEAWERGDACCDRRGSQRCRSSELGCPCCPSRWLAQEKLSEAARAAAEPVYQKWLARKALSDSTRLKR
jgi:hypothetical protein